MTSLNAAQLAQYIDHTYLKAEARQEDIARICQEALQFKFYSVCVNGSWVSYCSQTLRGSGIHVAAVCGFPLGAMASTVKAMEAAKAVEDGATEIDMVLPVGKLLDGDHAAVHMDIEAVVKAVEGQAIVKVIFETGMLNEDQKKAACQLSEQAGAHFVKTSTGFGPGGATVEDIRLMRSLVRADIGVKASGGVRDAATALAMIEAGATRIGTSSGPAIVQGLVGTTDY